MIMLNNAVHKMVDCFPEGDQTGTLRVWDARDCNRPLVSTCVHPGGALSDIKPVLPGSQQGLVATAGADRRVCVLEPRMNYEVVHEWTDH
eukprot:gene22118-8691_t